MVNHVVLFSLKKFSVENKKEILAELKVLLESLKEKIDEVIYLEVGLNYQLEAKSYDICLISHFESFESLDRYRVHPEHLKVVERINETTESRAAVDFEF